MNRHLTLLFLCLAFAACASLACVEVDRLTAEVQGVEETDDGIAVTVEVTNEGDVQDLSSVELGVFAIDTTGAAWQAADACSTVIGQTVHEGQPVTGTICFPFEREDDETGVVGPYVPRGTTIAYLLLTDNLFVSDQNRYHIEPVTPVVASSDATTSPETVTPTPPVAPTYPSSVTVDVTVWQHVQTGAIYLSTRPQGKGWTTHNTPLDMSQLHEGGNFYQGSAITVEIPVEPIE